MLRGSQFNPSYKCDIVAVILTLDYIIILLLQYCRCFSPVKVECTWLWRNIACKITSSCDWATQKLKCLVVSLLNVSRLLCLLLHWHFLVCYFICSGCEDVILVLHSVLGYLVLENLFLSVIDSSTVLTVLWMYYIGFGTNHCEYVG